jgi:hypothetical protein
MARRRMLDPSLWDDEHVGVLCAEARLLFVGCFSQADDEGRLLDSPARLKKIVFGFADVTLQQIEEWLQQIDAAVTGFLRYEVEGRRYIAFLNWGRYQVISHPQASQIPPPAVLTSTNGGNGNGQTESPRACMRLNEGSLVEVSLAEAKAALPPTPASSVHGFNLHPLGVAYREEFWPGGVRQDELTPGFRAIRILQTHPVYTDKRAINALIAWKRENYDAEDRKPFAWIAAGMWDIMSKSEHADGLPPIPSWAEAKAAWNAKEVTA